LAAITAGKGATKLKDKMNRDDYVQGSIAKAIETQRTVYDKPVKSPPVAISKDGYLPIFELLRHVDGCVWVEEDKKVLCPDGAMLDPDQFKVRYGGYEFQMQADGSRSTKDAFEAFTQNRMYQFPKVRSRDYNPQKPFGHIENNTVNTFRPANVVKTQGDVGPFLDLLTKMMPDANDRAIFLSWCASLVQNPGRKFQFALVVQGTQGNGKSFLLKCLEYSVGPSLTHLPNPEDMNEQFNSYIESNLFIGVEEVHMEHKRDMLDRLKKYITNDRIEIRGMRANKRMAPNLTNWFFCTNYKDAVLKSRDDRRYAIFFTAQQEASDLVRDGMGGDYFPRLWNWARGGGFAAVAGYLSRMTIPAALDPAVGAHRAPETSSTAEAIQESFGNYEQFLIEAIESETRGFTGGWITTVDARDYLRNMTGKSISKRLLGEALKAIGYRQHPARPRLSNGRVTVYCLPENLDKLYPGEISHSPNNLLPFPGRLDR
jgi:hypothetical protein